MATAETPFETRPTQEIAIVLSAPPENRTGSQEGPDMAVERKLFFTKQKLQKLFDVTGKTVARWQQRGLDHCYPFGNRKQKGFRVSDVQRFIAGNREHIKRAANFSRLTQEQIEKIIFDEENPDLAVFPNRTGPPNEKMRKKMRAQRIFELNLNYMPNDDFDKPNASKEILGPMPPGDDGNGQRRKTRAPAGLPAVDPPKRAKAGLPPYLASLYETPLLTPEQEQYLFRKFNYLKHKASRLREGLNPEHPNKKMMDKIEELYKEAVRTKNKIVQSNLRLVVAIVRDQYETRDLNEFMALVSDGNDSLMKAVEKFDYARGTKFSTYASWAIKKNFARTIPAEFKRSSQFKSNNDGRDGESFFDDCPDPRTNQAMQKNNQQKLKEIVEKFLSHLGEREQYVIIARFGLGDQEPQTLKEVGADLGITKERVRQIEARALKKLRSEVRRDHIEPPEPSATEPEGESYQSFMRGYFNPKTGNITVKKPSHA